MRLSRPSRSLVAAWLTLIVTSLALLAAAGWNRREQSVELPLTERELALPAVRQEDGRVLALSLRMAHQTPGLLRRAARRRQSALPPVRYEWLDQTKLSELGFATELEASHEDAAERYARATPRRVYLVLEYDGEAWRQWIASREAEVEKLRLDAAGALADAEAVLEIDRTMRSRLFPIDAGTDAETLRQLYPDKNHIVLAGVVRPTVKTVDGIPTLTGELVRLLVDRVHVPRSARVPLEPFLSTETWRELDARERTESGQGWPPSTAPRYRVKVAVGARGEPWLVSAEPS